MYYERRARLKRVTDPFDEERRGRVTEKQTLQHDRVLVIYAGLRTAQEWSSLSRVRKKPILILIEQIACLAVDDPAPAFVGL